MPSDTENIDNALQKLQKVKVGDIVLPEHHNNLVECILAFAEYIRHRLNREIYLPSRTVSMGDLILPEDNNDRLDSFYDIAYIIYYYCNSTEIYDLLDNCRYVDIGDQVYADDINNAVDICYAIRNYLPIRIIKSWHTWMSNFQRNGILTRQNTHTIYVIVSLRNLLLVSPYGSVRKVINLYEDVSNSPSIDEFGNIYLPLYFRVIRMNVYGDIQWSFQLIDPNYYDIPHGITIYPNDRLYVSDRNGRLYCIDLNGNLRWIAELNVELAGSVIYDSRERIYVATKDGKIISLTSDGYVRWTFDTARPIRYDISFGYKYGSYERIYASVGVYGYGGVNPYQVYSLYTDGSTDWVYNLYYPPASPAVISPLGEVFVCTTHSIGAYEYSRVYSLSETGRLRWMYPDTRYIYVTMAYDYRNSQIYVAYSNYLLRCLNADNGSVKWQIDLSSWYTGAPAIDSYQNVYIFGGTYVFGYLYSFDRYGNSRFTLRVEGVSSISLAMD